MINKDQVTYGDKITVTLRREGLPDAVLSGTAEEPQPGFITLAGWSLTDDRVTLTKYEAQWLEPPDWQTWDGLTFDGRRYIRVVKSLVGVGSGVISGLPPLLPTIWRSVDDEKSLTDAELLAAMKGRRVVRLVLSEVWS